ncbi:MAG: lamin tail domain-containing protein, partial [Bacteroidota bacterium]
PEPDEKFSTRGGSPVAPSDSITISTTHPPLGSGDHRFIAVVSFAADENRSNDTASVVVSVGAEKGSIIVNEIMYDPLTGQNEWVEFYNRSSSAVDIARWRFVDRPTASGAVNSFTITTASRSVQPGDFVVVAAESTILSLFPHLRTPTSGQHLFILNRSGGFSLNNDGDDVVLLDFAGQAIDSVSYSTRWHHPDVTDTKGRSLERINPNLDSNDPRNWSTNASLVGGTPGLPNSVFTAAPPSAASLSVAPNPFSPDSDGFEDFCSVRYNLPTSTSTIGVKIFDVKGRLIRTLANSELAGAEGEIVWDGLDDGRQRVRIGPYIIFLEALDSQGGTVATAKAVVVVATKL